MLDCVDGVKQAAVAEFSKGTILAKSERPHEFKLSDAELKALLEIFSTSDKNSSPKNVYLQDVPYTVPYLPYSEPHLLIGTGETSGFIAAKTGEAAVIAIYEGSLRYADQQAVQDRARMAADILTLKEDNFLVTLDELTRNLNVS